MPPMFYGIKIRRVSGKKKKITSCFFYQISCLSRFMKSSIVHNNRSALRENGEKNSFKPYIDYICIASSFESEWSDQLSIHQTCDHTHPLPFLSWDILVNFLSFRGSCILTKETVINPSLINENKGCRI